MKTLWLLISMLLILEGVHSQHLPGCLNHRGEVVDWFLIYYTPKSRHEHTPLYGYMYMDSTFKKEEFDIYQGYGDQEDGPLGLTVAQVKLHQMKSIAWNDQLDPDQGVGNSNKAHAKFFMSLKDKSAGFAVAHSAPKFPTISEEGQFGAPPLVDESQKIKAQHFLCMSIKGQELAKRLIDNSCFIKPNVYHNSLEFQCKHQNLKDYFIYDKYEIGKTTVQGIHKDGDKTADIFQEAITTVVQSSIIIQTFGSPKPYPPTCDGTYSVGNTNQIVVSPGVRWTQGSDHSKWAYAIDNDFVCFGDLNRNTHKQLERGGSFFCIDDNRINMALKKINPLPSGCA